MRKQLAVLIAVGRDGGKSLVVGAALRQTTAGLYISRGLGSKTKAGGGSSTDHR